jgi:hypothetical protein
LATIHAAAKKLIHISLLGGLVDKNRIIRPSSCNNNNSIRDGRPSEVMRLYAFKNPTMECNGLDRPVAENIECLHDEQMAQLGEVILL